MPKYKYETDQGTVARIELSEAKGAIAGAPPAGPIGEGNWFITAGGSARKRNSLRARAWVYSRSVDVAGETRKLVIGVAFPKLTPTAYEAAAPETQEYEGDVYDFVGKRPEQ